MSIVMQINPFDFFADTHGDALDAGYVWIGLPNTDPRQYPVTVYYDSDLSIPAPMPLRTTSGYISRNGAPAFLYIAGNYSVMVRDSRDRQIYYVPDFLLIGSSQAAPVGNVERVVQNVAALRNLTIISGSTTAATKGYYSAGDGGGDSYYVDVSDNTSADNGGSIIVAVDGTRWKQRDIVPVDIRKWGASTSVADNSVRIQAAIDFAQASSAYVFIPPGVFKYATTLQQTRRLVVYGGGGDTSVLEYSGPGDAWLAKPPFAGASNTGWIWRDFGIVPSAPEGGAYGLHIQLTAAVTPAVCFLADSQITNMVIGAFGSWGVYLDNSVGNTDGFFTSQFEYNTIVNGFRGDKVGDSLHFAHNKLYGKNLFQMEGVPGARQMTIEDMNITTTGGLIALLDVEEPTIRECQLEHPGYLSGYTGSFGAGVLLFNCFKPELISNTINSDNGAATAPVSPGLPPTTVALTGTTSFAYIDRNDIQKGSSFHIQIGNVGVTKTYIGEFNRYYSAAPVIGDGGTDTKRILYGEISYDPPSIANNTATGTSIPVADAVLGMQVQVSFAQNLAGLLLTGWVLSPGTVSVQFANFTGAPVDLAPAVLRVRVTS